MSKANFDAALDDLLFIAIGGAMTKTVAVSWLAKWQPLVGQSDAKRLFKVGCCTMGQNASRSLTVKNYLGADMSKSFGDQGVDASQNAGRDMIGVAGGVGNTNYVNAVKELAVTLGSATSDQSPLVDILKKVEAEISRVTDEDEKGGLMANLSTVAKAVIAGNPLTGLAKMAWGALISFKDSIPSLDELGEML